MAKPRVQKSISITCRPSITYDNGTSTDRVDQNLNGTVLLTPITDTLTVNIQTYANEAGASGNTSNQAGLSWCPAPTVSSIISGIYRRIISRIMAISRHWMSATA